MGGCCTREMQDMMFHLTMRVDGLSLNLSISGVLGSASRGTQVSNMISIIREEVPIYVAVTMMRHRDISLNVRVPSPMAISLFSDLARPFFMYHGKALDIFVRDPLFLLLQSSRFSSQRGVCLEGLEPHRVSGFC